MAKGIGRAFDATVSLTDYASASVGTSLGPRLLEAATDAAAESRAAAASGDPEKRNNELERCLVAILCAHAAVEAQLNEALLAEHRDWLADHEKVTAEWKWGELQKKRTGKMPPGSDLVRKAVQRLETDRNLVAHFKGLPQPDGAFAVAGAPVVARGGISQVRAHFDAARAKSSVDDADLVFETL